MKKVARFLKEHVSEIMEEWDVAVRKKVEASQSVNDLALHNHLPSLISDIADILIRCDGMKGFPDVTSYPEVLDNSINHGRHRSTTSNYTEGQVIHEYMIFHRAISNVLSRNSLLTLEVSELLKYVIETCILESVDSFSQSINEMQEKLIGTLAHDIRNPLGVARLASELLKENLEPTDLERIKSMLSRSIKKALLLTEGLLDSISVRSGEGMMLKFENHNIVKEIGRVYEEARDTYSRQIIMDCPSPQIDGVFDAIAICRMVENLLTNAIKYGSKDAPITLIVKDYDYYLTIGVHNFGNPIPKDKHHEIFGFLESSTSGEQLRSSWGMGLTLVKMVAEGHGGSVEVHSTPEDGTTFNVSLKKDFNQPGAKRVKLNRTM